MELPEHSLPRKAYRSDLSDAQWNRIKRLLPKPKRYGRPRVNDHEVINGILYVLNTGCRWEDLPHDIDASYQTCNRRLLEYQRRRIWQRFLLIDAALQVTFCPRHSRVLNFNNFVDGPKVIDTGRSH